MKKLLSTVLLALVALAGLAQNVNTWNEVIVGYSNVRPLTVTSVTLYEDRTEVREIRCRRRSQIPRLGHPL